MEVISPPSPSPTPSPTSSFARITRYSITSLIKNYEDRNPNKNENINFEQRYIRAYCNMPLKKKIVIDFIG